MCDILQFAELNEMTSKKLHLYGSKHYMKKCKHRSVH